MTFFHCINCIILTYAPLVVFYRASGLNRDRHLGLLFKSMLGFCVSSMIKMAIAATLAGSDVESQSSFINEILYSFTSLIDAMCIAYLIDSAKFEIRRRIEYVALGWTAGEAIMTKFMPLVIYSRSPEVDYKWIQFSLDSSFDLFFTLSYAFAVWMVLCGSRKVKATMQDLIFLGVHVVVLGLLSYLKNQEILNGWWMVIVHAVVSCALYYMSRMMFKRKMEKRD